MNSLNTGRSGLDVGAGLEQHYALSGELAANLDAAQKFGGLVAPHGADDHFEFARHLGFSGGGVRVAAE